MACISQFLYFSEMSPVQPLCSLHYLNAQIGGAKEEDQQLSSDGQKLLGIILKKNCLIIYMFQCCSLETSHPRLLPQSPKVCSVHLCLFFCFAYRVIITIFLNSIYMCQYTVLVFIFLAYFTLYNGLLFHPSHQN